MPTWRTDASGRRKRHPATRWKSSRAASQAPCEYTKGQCCTYLHAWGDESSNRLQNYAGGHLHRDNLNRPRQDNRR
ncbi:hypothetical protein LB503_007873 [Fusarium chuoi]|nr:hypothetical protein LB503_007873 [Fusarium chuoi]